MKWTERDVQRFAEAAKRLHQMENPEMISYEDRDHSTEIDLVLERIVALSDSVPQISNYEDVTLVVNDTQPFAAVNEITDMLESAETSRLRGVWPVVNSLHHEACLTRIKDGVETEFIVDSTSLAAMQETSDRSAPIQDQYEQWLSTLSQSNNCAVHLSPTRVQFDLFIVDDEAALGLYPTGHFDPDSDASGYTEICLRGTDEEFRAWANRLFEAHRESAERLS